MAKEPSRRRGLSTCAPRPRRSLAASAGAPRSPFPQPPFPRRPPARAASQPARRARHRGRRARRSQPARPAGPAPRRPHLPQRPPAGTGPGRASSRAASGARTRSGHRSRPPALTDIRVSTPAGTEPGPTSPAHGPAPPRSAITPSSRSRRASSTSWRARHSPGHDLDQLVLEPDRGQPPQMASAPSLPPDLPTPARELQRVTRVGLDPITRRARDRARRADHHTSIPGALANRASPNPVGRASYLTRTGPGNRRNHSIAAPGDPSHRASQTSPDPNRTAAAASGEDAAHTV